MVAWILALLLYLVRAVEDGLTYRNSEAGRIFSKGKKFRLKLLHNWLLIGKPLSWPVYALANLIRLVWKVRQPGLKEEEEEDLPP